MGNQDSSLSQNQSNSEYKGKDDNESDGFPHDFDITKYKIKAKITAGNQEGDETYEIDSNHLATWHRKAKQNNMMQCIGQLLMWWGQYEDDEKEEKSLTGGTATIFKKLSHDYYVAITCAHNFIHYDAIDKQRKSPKNIWYFAKGSSNIKCSLKCKETVIYNDNHDDVYDPTQKVCPNDLALVLLHDNKGRTTKHFKNIKINDSIILDEWTGDTTALFSLWGYPIKSNGQLQGQNQRAAIKKERLWKYEGTLYTYPGHSGSALYERKFRKGSDTYNIYGIHIYGDVKEQKNCAVFLDRKKLNWIEANCSKFEQMIMTLPKPSQTKDDSDTDDEKVAPPPQTEDIAAPQMLFKFEKQEYNQISKDGYTMQNIVHDKWQTTLLGSFLSGETPKKYSFDFRLDKYSSHESIAIGIVTTEFNTFTTDNFRFVKRYSFFHYGNGNVFYDTKMFKCRDKVKKIVDGGDNQCPYFTKIGVVIRFSIDMKRKMAGLNGLMVKVLHPPVCVAILSKGCHKITVVEQNQEL